MTPAAVIPDAPPTAPGTGHGALRSAWRWAWLPVVAAAAVAIAFRPWTLRLGRALPNDLGDPPFIVWTLRWVSAALRADPTRLFDANIFFPSRDTLAYSESLLPLAVPYGALYALTGNQVLAHNLLLLGLFGLSVITTYLLARRVLDREAATGTATPVLSWPALVAALGFTFSGFAMSQVSHLQIVTHGLIALAALALLRLLEHPRPGRGVQAGLASALLVLSSLYFGALWYVSVAAVLAVHLWRTRPPLRRIAAGYAAFAAVTAALVLPVARPYLRAANERAINEAVALRWADLIQPANRSLWAKRVGGDPTTSGEHIAFPGFVVLGLAALGAVLVVQRRRRARPGSPLGELELLALAGALGLGVALGPSILGLPGPFQLLHGAAPGFSGIRAVSRYVVLPLLAVALLAGWGARAVLAALASRPARTSHRRAGERGRPGRPRLVAAAGAGLAALTLVELAAPWRPVDVPDDAVGRAISATLDTLPAGAVAVVPLTGPTVDERRISIETLRMLSSTGDWKPRVNGYSGFFPPGYDETVRRLNGLPAASGWARLDELDVRYLVVSDPLRAATVVAGLPRPARLWRFGPSVLADLRPAAGQATGAAERRRIADELAASALADPSFESPALTWALVNNKPAGRLTLARGGRTGRQAVRVQATQPQVSIAEDPPVLTAPGGAVQGRIYARSARPAPVPVVFALWALCPEPRSSSAAAVVGPDWTPLTVTLAAADACPVRFEVYVNAGRPGAPAVVDLDDASLAVTGAPAAEATP